MLRNLFSSPFSVSENGSTLFSFVVSRYNPAAIPCNNILKNPPFQMS